MQKSLWVFVEASSVMLNYGLAYKYTPSLLRSILYIRKNAHDIMKLCPFDTFLFKAQLVPFPNN